jgi:hypothetical protein
MDNLVLLYPILVYLFCVFPIWRLISEARERHMERKSEGWSERYLIAKYGTVTSGACKKGMKWIQEEKRWEKVYHKTMQSARLSQAVLSSLPRFWVDDQNWSVGSKRSDARFSSLVRRRAWKRVMRISNSMQKARNPSFLSSLGLFLSPLSYGGR